MTNACDDNQDDSCLVALRQRALKSRKAGTPHQASTQLEVATAGERDFDALKKEHEPSVIEEKEEGELSEFDSERQPSPTEEARKARPRSPFSIPRQRPSRLHINKRVPNSLPMTASYLNMHHHQLLANQPASPVYPQPNFPVLAPPLPQPPYPAIYMPTVVPYPYPMEPSWKYIYQQRPQQLAAPVPLHSVEERRRAKNLFAPSDLKPTTPPFVGGKSVVSSKHQVDKVNQPNLSTTVKFAKSKLSKSSHAKAKRKSIIIELDTDSEYEDAMLTRQRSISDSVRRIIEAEVEKQNELLGRYEGELDAIEGNLRDVKVRISDNDAFIAKAIEKQTKLKEQLKSTKDMIAKGKMLKVELKGNRETLEKKISVLGESLKEIKQSVEKKLAMLGTETVNNPIKPINCDINVPSENDNVEIYTAFTDTLEPLKSTAPLNFPADTKNVHPLTGSKSIGKGGMKKRTAELIELEKQMSKLEKNLLASKINILQAQLVGSRKKTHRRQLNEDGYLSGNGLARAFAKRQKLGASPYQKLSLDRLLLEAKESVALGKKASANDLDLLLPQGVQDFTLSSNLSSLAAIADEFLPKHNLMLVPIGEDLLVSTAIAGLIVQSIPKVSVAFSSLSVAQPEYIQFGKDHGMDSGEEGAAVQFDSLTREQYELCDYVVGSETTHFTDLNMRNDPPLNDGMDKSYKPYTSIFEWFKASRFSKNFISLVPVQGLLSVTYNNKIDPMLIFCRDEFSETSACSSRKRNRKIKKRPTTLVRNECLFQHFDQIRMSDNEILEDMVYRLIQYVQADKNFTNQSIDHISATGHDFDSVGHEAAVNFIKTKLDPTSISGLPLVTVINRIVGMKSEISSFDTIINFYYQAPLKSNPITKLNPFKHSEPSAIINNHAQGLAHLSNALGNSRSSDCMSAPPLTNTLKSTPLDESLITRLCVDGEGIVPKPRLYMKISIDIYYSQFLRQRTNSCPSNPMAIDQERRYYSQAEAMEPFKPLLFIDGDDAIDSLNVNGQNEFIATEETLFEHVQTIFSKGNWSLEKRIDIAMDVVKRGLNSGQDTFSDLCWLLYLDLLSLKASTRQANDDDINLKGESEDESIKAIIVSKHFEALDVLPNSQLIFWTLLERLEDFRAKMDCINMYMKKWNMVETTNFTSDYALDLLLATSKWLIDENHIEECHKLFIFLLSKQSTLSFAPADHPDASCLFNILDHNVVKMMHAALNLDAIVLLSLWYVYLSQNDSYPIDLYANFPFESLRSKDIYFMIKWTKPASFNLCFEILMNAMGNPNEHPSKKMVSWIFYNLVELSLHMTKRPLSPNLGEEMEIKSASSHCSVEKDEQRCEEEQSYEDRIELIIEKCLAIFPTFEEIALFRLLRLSNPVGGDSLMLDYIKLSYHSFVGLLLALLVDSKALSMAHKVGTLYWTSFIPNDQVHQNTTESLETVGLGVATTILGIDINEYTYRMKHKVATFPIIIIDLDPQLISTLRANPMVWINFSLWLVAAASDEQQFAIDAIFERALQCVTNPFSQALLLACYAKCIEKCENMPNLLSKPLLTLNSKQIQFGSDESPRNDHFASLKSDAIGIGTFLDILHGIDPETKTNIYTIVNGLIKPTSFSLGQRLLWKVEEDDSIGDLIALVENNPTSLTSWKLLVEYLKICGSAYTKRAHNEPTSFAFGTKFRRLVPKQLRPILGLL